MKHLLAALALLFAAQSSAMVKLSEFGMKCHTENSPYYSRIVNYTEHANMDMCVISLGYDSVSKCVEDGNCYDPLPSEDGYDREEMFGTWDDPDGNCLNTRHQLLAVTSFNKVSIKDCMVVDGTWISNFTNAIITNPEEMDIDHIVPLNLALTHGATEWTQEKREAFATDTDNLWAVELSLNRSKGARGLEWLPPANECQYIIKYLNIVEKYGVEFKGADLYMHKKKRFEYCGF